MFEECKSLADLNAARIQALMDPSADVMSINEAYNTARQSIMNTSKTYVVLEPRVVQPRAVVKYSAIPVVGTSNKRGSIQLTDKGFLY